MTATKPNGTPIEFRHESRVDYIWDTKTRQWTRVIKHFKVLNANDFLEILRDNETRWYLSKQRMDV